MAARRPARPPQERGLRILLLPLTNVRRLGFWRILALLGALLVVVGTLLELPQFGWIEAAELLIAVSAVRMIARHVESRPFATPFADGTMLAVAGIWAALVAFVNTLFDDAGTRSGIVVVAGCAALFLAGMKLRLEEGRRWYEEDQAV